MDVKRLLTFLLLICALLTPVVTRAAAAQDATPAAPPAANGGVALLQGLGLAEVTITVTDTDSTVPASVPAGRVLLHAINQTGGELDLSFGQTPDGVTDQDILDIGNADTVPAWFYETTFPGGVDVAPPATEGYAVINLTPGDWKFDVDRNAANDGDQEPTDEVKTITVTGEAAKAEAIPGAVDVTAYSFGFELPETISAGPQIWHFRNGGSQPHFLFLASVPDGTTVDDVMQLVMFDPSSGTPVPAGSLQFEDVGDVADAALLSPDQEEWIGLDLAPGTYVALGFIPDPAAGAPHAALGMIKVFTVA
jgi:hypothetical protein